MSWLSTGTSRSWSPARISFPAASSMSLVRQILAKSSLEGDNWPELKNNIKDEVHRFIFDKIKRNPMILPIILDV